MTDRVKQFDRLVLGPAQSLTIGLAVYALFTWLFWFLAGCCLVIFLLGVVGAQLHPLQSTADLFRALTSGQATTRESLVLQPEEQFLLVNKACLKVGSLLGIVSFVLLANAHWHWYWAAFAACWACIMVVAALMVAFGVMPIDV